MAVADKTIRYGTYNHMFAAMWNDVEGYVFTNGIWHTYHPADLTNDAGLLSKSAYDKLYPKLPPLPPGAFTS